MNLSQLEQIRASLIKAVHASQLKWFRVKLPDDIIIEVCNPVRVRFVVMVNRPVQSKSPTGKSITGETQEPHPTLPVDWFVPVTQPQTWEFAKLFNALPLTAAVADHVHNQAMTVAKPASPELKDFPTYSKRLDTYTKNYGQNLVSGAHKIWALSNVGHAIGAAKIPSVNYGFYVPLHGNSRPEKAPKHRVQSPLVSADVIQSLANGHDGFWWDYSQLLQLMRAPDDIFYNRKRYSLREAVKQGLPPVWDEKEPLHADLLPS